MAGINPMAFVTPYTAVGTGRSSGGNDLANALASYRQGKVSQGYLDLQNRQQAENEKRFGQAQVDKARAELDDAILGGNEDHVEIALNNLRTIGSRYGYDVSEQRSGRAERFGMSTTQSEERVAPALRAPGGTLPVAARSPLTGAEKSPAELERDMIAESEGDTERPARLEQGSETTPEYKAYLAKRYAASEEVPTAPPPLKAPGGSLPAQPTPEGPPPLRGYSIHGPDGKPIYSVSPNDVIKRQRERVGGVFASLKQKTGSPEEQQWLEQAQTEAEKLLPVFGPQKAAEEGLKWFIGRVNGANKLDVVKANKRGGGGPGGGPGLMGKSQDVAESVQVYDDNARQEAAKVQDEDRQFEVMEQKLASNDPAIQRDAVNDLLKLRSGTAVTASEDARIQQINGMLPKIQNMLGRWTGGDMDPAFLHTMQTIIALKRQANKAKIQRIYQHQADLYEAQNAGKTKDPEVLKKRSKVLREGGGAPEETKTGEENLY